MRSVARGALFAVGRWLIRVTGLRVVRVRVVIEKGDRYIEGYADALVQAGRLAPADEPSATGHPRLRLVDEHHPVRDLPTVRQPGRRRVVNHVPGRPWPTGSPPR